MNDLQTLGLIYDIFGVVVLGTSLLKRRRVIARLTHPTHDANVLNYDVPAIEDFVKDKWDALLGTTVLVFGFTMQIFGKISLQPLWCCAVVGLLLVIVLVYYSFVRQGALLDKEVGKVQAAREPPSTNGE